MHSSVKKSFFQFLLCASFMCYMSGTPLYYTATNIAHDQPRAAEACSSKGGQLAVVSDSTIEAQVLALISQYSSLYGHVWIHDTSYWHKVPGYIEPLDLTHVKTIVPGSSASGSMKKLDPATSATFVCEAETDVTPSTTGSCHLPPPDVDTNATMTQTSTHVTYTCDPGYQYMDGTSSKQYQCGAAKFAEYYLCIPLSREVCYSSYTTIEVSRTLQDLMCTGINATQASVHCPSDQEKIDAVIAVSGDSHLGTTSTGGRLRWTKDDTYVLWSKPDHKVLPKQSRRLCVNTNGFWETTCGTFNFQICEFPRDTACIKPPPTMENAAVTVSGSTVTYTCHTNYQFHDGTSSKSFPCQCVSTAVLNPCGLTWRAPVQYQYFPVWVNEVEGQRRCEEQGFAAAKILNEDEEDQVQDLLNQEPAWISGALEGILRWDDGDVMVFHRLERIHGSGVHRKGFYIDGNRWESVTDDIMAHFLCEIYPHPGVACPAVFPEVEGATRSGSGPDITYTCATGFMFDDLQVSKTFTCEDVRFAGIWKCYRSTRNVCYGVSMRRGLPQEINATCAGLGGAMVKILSEEENNIFEQALPQQLNEGVIIGAHYDQTMAAFYWRDNGEAVLWLEAAGHVNHLNFVNHNVAMRPNGEWIPYDSTLQTAIACETMEDQPCGNPPELANGFYSSPFYTCNNGFEFPDGEPKKLFYCECAKLINLWTCVKASRDMDYLPYKFVTSAEAGQKICSKYGGSLPILLNEGDNDDLVDALGVSGSDHAYLGINCTSSSGVGEMVCRWMDDASSPIYWNDWDSSVVGPTSIGMAVWLSENNGRWSTGYTMLDRNYPLTCQISGAYNCSSAPDNIPFTSRSVGGSTVTYTCQPGYEIPGGGSSITYSCTPAQLAPLNPCSRVEPLCVVLPGARTTHTYAEAYCASIGGNFTGVYNEDVWLQVKDIRAALPTGGYNDLMVAGSDEELEGLYTFPDGSLMTDHGDATFYMKDDPQEHYLKIDAYARFVSHATDYEEGLFFTCYKPEETMSSPCQLVPSMPNGQVTRSSGNLEVECNANAQFADGQTFKSFKCECGDFVSQHQCHVITRPNLCYQLIPQQRPFLAQEGVCAMHNTTLAKVLSESDITKLTSDIDIDPIFLGARDNAGIYKWSDGTLVTYNGFLNNKWHVGNITSDVLTLQGGYFRAAHADELLYAVCEVDAVFDCASAPEVDNAVQVVETTSVQYNCISGYQFFDGQTSKTYNCTCAQLAALHPCIIIDNNACLVRSEFLSTPIAASLHCLKHGGIPARVIHPTDITRIKAVAFAEPHSNYVHINGNDETVESMWQYNEGSVMTSASLTSPLTLPPYNTTLNYARLEYDNPDWTHGPASAYAPFVCEAPNDTACSNPVLSMPNASYSINNQEVVYTCDAGFSFPDGTTSRTFTCTCLTLITLNPCRAPRNVVFMAAPVMLDQLQAYQFCAWKATKLARVMDDSEAVRIYDIASQHFPMFLIGMDSIQEHVFRWGLEALDDGDLVEWNTGWATNPENTDAMDAMCAGASSVFPCLHTVKSRFICESDRALPVAADVCDTVTDMKFATKTINSGQVEYVCEEYAAYEDGSVRKTFPCEHYNIAFINPCTPEVRPFYRRILNITALTYAEAEVHCTGLGGQVAVAYSLLELEIIKSIIGASMTWLGVSDAVMEGVWLIHGDDVMAFDRWQGGGSAPMNQTLNHLVYDGANDTMLAASTTDTYPVLCEIPPGDSCEVDPPNVTHSQYVITGGGVTYYCDYGYTFPDGHWSKDYACTADGLAQLETCQTRSTFVSSYKTTYSRAVAACELLSLSLPDTSLDMAIKRQTEALLKKWNLGHGWVGGGSPGECPVKGERGIQELHECTEEHYFICNIPDETVSPLPNSLPCWMANDLIREVPDSLVKAACPRGKVYVHPELVSNQGDASRHCEQLGGALAHVAGEQEANILQAFSIKYKGTSPSHALLMWIDGDEKEMAGTWKSPIHGALTAPSNVAVVSDTRPGDCLSMSGLQWQGTECLQQLHFVCEVDQEQRMVNGCLWIEESAADEVLGHQLCRAKGGTLATFTNILEFVEVTRDILATQSMVWVGGVEEVHGWISERQPLTWTLWGSILPTSTEGGRSRPMKCLAYSDKEKAFVKTACDNALRTVCRATVHSLGPHVKLVYQTAADFMLTCDAGYVFSDGSTVALIPQPLPTCDVLDDLAQLVKEAYECHCKVNVTAIFDSGFKQCIDMLSVRRYEPAVNMYMPLSWQYHPEDLVQVSKWHPGVTGVAAHTLDSYKVTVSTRQNVLSDTTVMHMMNCQRPGATHDYLCPTITESCSVMIKLKGAMKGSRGARMQVFYCDVQ